MHVKAHREAGAEEQVDREVRVDVEVNKAVKQNLVVNRGMRNVEVQQKAYEEIRRKAREAESRVGSHAHQ